MRSVQGNDRNSLLRFIKDLVFCLHLGVSWLHPVRSIDPVEDAFTSVRVDPLRQARNSIVRL